MNTFLKSLAMVSGVLALVSCGENPGIVDDQPATVSDDPVASSVVPGKPAAPVDLTFELRAEPIIGQMLPIDVTLVPRAASQLLRVSFLGSEGLALQSPAASAYQQVEAGTEYQQQITVVPQANGVFQLAVVVTMGLGSEVTARTFTIPVIVGLSPVEKAQMREPAAVDATGQAIEVMPAEETRR